MKKSFTLLELVFVVLIISILSYLAITHNYKSVQKANLTQLDAEILLIRNAIEQNYNDRIMLNTSAKYIEFLDEASIETNSQTLFDGYQDDILLDPIIFSTTTQKKKIGQWIKTAQRSYKIYLNNNESVKFTYDNNKGSFDCNFKEPLCKELTQ